MSLAYNVEGMQWAWRGPEVVFADFNNNGTKDEINLISDTFWALPVRIDSENPVIVRKKRTINRRYGHGSRYISQIQQDDWDVLELIFEGPVYNRYWVPYVLDGVTEAADTPSAGIYTKTFTLSTQSITQPPKTIELLSYIPNAGSGNNQILLRTGGIVKEYTERGGKGQQIIGRYVVEVRNEITGAVLTSWPSYPKRRLAHFEQAPLTYSTGGVTRLGRFDNYEFTIKTDKMLDKGGGDEYMTEAQSPNKVELDLKIGWETKNLLDIDDMRLDPTSANNMDLTLKQSWHTTNDFWQIQFVDCFGELFDAGIVNGRLQHGLHFYYNPDESSGDVVLTEVNTNPARF